MPEPRFMYGSHYSSPGYVLFYLVRVGESYTASSTLHTENLHTRERLSLILKLFAFSLKLQSTCCVCRTVVMTMQTECLTGTIILCSQNCVNTHLLLYSMNYIYCLLILNVFLYVVLEIPGRTA